MKISITPKTLITIIAFMGVAVLGFSSGYFKSQIDCSQYSDKYTVSVEKNWNSEENAGVDEIPETQDGLMVNINTASADELMKLNGIGEKLAERIIKYREENGAFKNRYDIMDVSGIGTGIYENIRDSICVS
ncbi:MAG: helix-hairpin-helix domain-containing protein [Clostridiales bacterium]|nr:helix-hairpin-helix domain-containing protein [Clostridiales bacterium]